MGLGNIELAPNKEPIDEFLESFGITIEQIQDMQIGQRLSQSFLDTKTWHIHKAILTRTANGFEIKFFDNERRISGTDLSEKSDWLLSQDGGCSMSSGSFQTVSQSFLRSKNGALEDVENRDWSKNAWVNTTTHIHDAVIVERLRLSRENQ